MSLIYHTLVMMVLLPEDGGKGCEIAQGHLSGTHCWQEQAFSAYLAGDGPAGVREWRLKSTLKVQTFQSGGSQLSVKHLPHPLKTKVFAKAARNNNNNKMSTIMVCFSEKCDKAKDEEYQEVWHQSEWGVRWRRETTIHKLNMGFTGNDECSRVTDIISRFTFIPPIALSKLY